MHKWIYVAEAYPAAADRKTEPWTVYSAPYSATHLGKRATIKRAWM